MSANDISISKYLELKGGTIEELRQYALSKGINLPDDCNHCLTPTELKTIDPTMAYRLKFSRALSSSKEMGREQVAERQSPKKETGNTGNTDNESLKILGHIDLSTINQNTRPSRNEEIELQSEVHSSSTKTEKKNKTPKRLIGVVKFFDSYKDFGFITTNSNGISGKPEDEKRLYSFYICSSEWKSSSHPVDGEWVVLTPHKNNRGKWNAINTERLSYNKDSLIEAMKYRGKYAKIEGYDSHSFESYNYNILCHIINKMAKKTVSGYSNNHQISYDRSTFPEIISAFCEYVSRFPSEQQKNVITQFVIDDELRNLLSLFFLQSEFESENDEQKSAYANFKSNLLDGILSVGTIKALDSLPEEFNLTVCHDKVIQILINESIQNEAATKIWLKKHMGIIEKISLDKNDLSALSLRVVLYQITENKEWVSAISTDWNSICQFINNTPSFDKISFLELYFANRDDEFISNHGLSTILTLEETKDWAEQIVSLGNENLFSLLKSFMNGEAGRDLALLQDFVNQNFDIKSIYGTIRTTLSIEIKENASCVRSVLDDFTVHGVTLQELFPNDFNVSDELLVELFVRTNDFEYLNNMDDFDSSYKWIANQPSDFVASFIKLYGPLVEDDPEGDTFIMSLGEDVVTGAMETLDEEEQFQILRFFPKDFATNVVSGHFADTKLFDLYIGEQWNKLKGKLPYIVFDLESDGDSVREFAFRKGDYTHYYEDEGQLESLIDVINSASIVVGHRIKQWDLKILEQRGTLSPVFVWDTLEIEILLNPCRYAYSLHTAHNAKDDTELTDRLFWNQLFRLAMDEDLCCQLSDFLPNNISQIIEELRQPNFSKFFKKSGGSEDSFYQSLCDTEEKIVEELSQINEETDDKRTLIIAPQRLWNRIAEHVSLSFIREDNGIDYLPISREKLVSKPLENPFLQAVILRFCDLSKTPIYSNLAPYLRIQYFDEQMLLDYVEIGNKSGIQCGDLRYINDLSDTFDFEKVYFVGCELENRLNQYTLPTPLRPSDFWNEKSSIPMRLGGSNYTVITSEDRKSLLFSDVPADASKVWIERMRDGRYLVNYNFDFHQKLEDLVAEIGRDTEIHDIPWLSETSDNSSVYLVRSGKAHKFDFSQKRVNSTTRYRSMYWMYQLALLNSIHTSGCALPIIYILEDNLEIDQVEQYAESIGFYIPKDGTLISRLEKITQRANGLLVVSKDKFFEITEKRLYHAYCYVWDQMAVEKHMMMWQNHEASVGNSTLNDRIKETGEELKKGSKKDTYQAFLISIWPVYQYYSRFVLANNAESKMYILDSFLEEYHTLSSVWNTSSFASTPLWNDEDTFANELKIAQGIFYDADSKNAPTDESSIKQAMDVILETLVPKSEGKERKWTDVQSKVLPEILSKKENYLISIPTGGGKSVLFQGPALYNASYTNKLSLVVTPLKALMQDQVRELSEKGFYTNVDFLNGDRTYQETRSIYRKINSGELAILYVTPERFRSRGFLNALMTRMAHDKGLEYMIFDEAHCISQWGMEFRPEYLNVIKKCNEFSKTFPTGMCIAMFSATVTDMIYNQINETVPVKRLGQDNDKKIYNPIRSHIGTSFQLVNHDLDSRIKAIVEYTKSNKIDFAKSRMLVFCKTRSQCEELAAKLPGLLVDAGVLQDKDSMERVGYFHAGLDADDRDDAYSRFKSNDDPIYILCATKAFGMGMDIPNIHYIVHLCPPNVLEDYLQEVGRAGRNKDMYERVGFNSENPIPTVCLYSTEDIKKSREQLLQSMLSWKNLEEIRGEILRYITNIQSVGTTKEIPIVIPNNLWKCSANDYEYTDFKLGEYWLERMARIKMGYLSPAHITITMNVQDPADVAALSSKTGVQTKRVYSAIAGIAKEKGTNTIQVSLQQIASELSIHTSKVLNELISCVKYNLISINQEIRCRIANTRRDEVPYMLNNERQELAFHIIINAATKILEDNVLNKEKAYSDKEIRAFMNMNDLQSVIKDVVRKTENGEERTSYMPWYNEDEKRRNKGLSIAKNYKKDLLGKRFRQIFVTLFDIVPNVKCKSYIDRESKTVKQSILVESNTWKTFLPSFKDDCLEVLKYIYKLQQNNVDYLNWADAINSLNFENKGFNYFDNIIRYLSGMAYIVTDNLLPTGIEVCCTDDSENPILENITSDSKDYEDKNAFDEAMQIRNLRLCVMDALSSKIKTKPEFQELISAYFCKTDANGFIELLSKYYADDDPIWDTVRETAIKSAEEKMKDNLEQWNIYNENSNTNVNIEAGPGSGKTHVLTMRCAKLIYRQHVRPDQILVLAYNRAVVVELKSRLTKLFSSLGLSRSAAQLHVYTFHGLAKKICGEKALEGLDMSEWEGALLKLMRKRPMEVTKSINEIQYILIDEFQDITQTRLEAMFELDKIYKHPAFFTIGDRDQSIYGFEKKESMDPEYYYKQLYDELKPKRMTMSTNYRSYPKILAEASKFLGPDSKMPVPCKTNKDAEPKEPYTFIYNNERNWVTEFQNTIMYLKGKKMTDVAVFFRTNNEVYRGYSLIRAMNLPEVRLRIQGASECELFRKREIYAVIHMIEGEGNKRLILENDATKNHIKSKISVWIKNLPNWDNFYLDFAYTLVLDYLDFAEGDEEQHTYLDMAESIRQTLAEENPQLYKLYDKYQSERILQDKQMNVVLTTMHKVKGLEFDAVVITPSVSSLPFDPTKDVDVNEPLTAHEKDCIEEERRLLYVAFTRARKFLMAYLGKRENAILNMQKYTSEDDTLGIRERHPGLDNYNIGYNAGYNFVNNRKIVNQVAKNAPVTIQRRDSVNRYGQAFHVFNVVCNGTVVGQLSKSSSIRRAMEESGKYSLNGYFVSDVYYWTYQDSVLADQRNLRINGYQTDFAANWSSEARTQGFIFIVSIAGYGN